MSACILSKTFGIALGCLSLLAMAGCTNSAVGTLDPAPSDVPSTRTPPSESADGADKPAGPSAPAPKPATVTVLVDGYPGTSDAPVLTQESGGTNARFSFSSQPFGAELQVLIKRTGKGCGLQDADNSIMMIKWASSEANVFTSELEGSSCGLVVTDKGTRLVGSFQGNLVNGDKSKKHSVALSFDIPAAP